MASGPPPPRGATGHFFSSRGRRRYNRWTLRARPSQCQRKSELCSLPALRLRYHQRARWLKGTQYENSRWISRCRFAGWPGGDWRTGRSGTSAGEVSRFFGRLLPRPAARGRSRARRRDAAGGTTSRAAAAHQIGAARGWFRWTSAGRTKAHSWRTWRDGKRSGNHACRAHQNSIHASGASLPGCRA